MKERAGIVLMVVGLVVVLIGGVGFAATSGDSDEVAAGESTTTASSTSTTLAPTTTTVPDTTTSSSSTTSMPAETTTSSSTTSSSLPAEPETVEEFVEDFAAALEDGDREFVLERLHPVVIDGWGAELCESWVDSEIMMLSNYTLLAVDTGPITQQVDTPAGPAEVENYFGTTVSYTFQGQDFESGGSFALVDDTMFWLGQCR